MAKGRLMKLGKHNKKEGKYFCVLALALFFFISSQPASAKAVDIPQILSQSRELAENKDYPKALSLLYKTEKSVPDNFEVKFLIAQILGWQGDYPAAEKRIHSLLKKHPDDPDLLLTEANLFFYQGKNAEAQKIYAKIVRKYPDYKEAQEGLERAKAPPPAKMLWQIDTGLEVSSFTRQSQSSWREQFVQLTRKITDDWTWHLATHRYDRFHKINMTYETGIDHRFSLRTYGYIYGALTPGGAFVSRRQVSMGGGTRLDPSKEKTIPLWAVLDTRFDDYGSTDTKNISPEIRVEPADGWALGAKYITVLQRHISPVHGWQVRMDGKLTGQSGFNIGYAKAPETSSGVTVETKTFFGGIRWDISSLHAINIGYAHDDRQNAYIRQVVNMSFTTRF